MDDFGDMRRVDRSDTYDASLPRDYLSYDLIQDNLCGPSTKTQLTYLALFTSVKLPHLISDRSNAC